MDFVSPRFVFLLLLIHSISSYQVSADDLTVKACEGALYKDLCLKTLQADPSSKQADLSRLAEIATKAALDAAVRISKEIKKLPQTSKEKAPLKDCSESYLSAKSQLKDSVRALRSKQYNDASTWITAAMTDSESCEQGFKQQPGSKNTLSEKNTNFEHLCSNALCVLNKIAKKV